MNCQELVTTILSELDVKVNVFFDHPKADEEGAYVTLKDDNSDLEMFFPSDIEKSWVPVNLRYINFLLSEKNIEQTSLARSVFTVLHEVGHVLDYRNRLNYDHLQYQRERFFEELELDRCISQFKREKYGTDMVELNDEDLYECLPFYYELKGEKIANDFAFEHLEHILKRLK